MIYDYCIKKVIVMKKKTMDLTSGNVTKLLISYSLPLIATSLLQSVYSIADLLIAGHTVGSVGISAINNSSQVMNLVTKIAIGLSIGGNVLISQYFGAGEKENKNDSVRTLFTFCMLLGALCSLVMWFCSRPLLILLKAPALMEAVTYLQICSIGFLFIWGYNALSAILRAMGDSRSPFVIIMISSVLNIILDTLFMAVLHMGVAGAALATLISQISSFVLGLYFVLKNPDEYGLALNKLRPYKDKLIRIIHLGIPCALQMTIAAISWLVVTYFINKYGTVVSAGNGISIKIKDVCQLITSAIATGTSTIIAQNLGAGLYDRARNVLSQALKIAVCTALVLMVFVELTAPYLAGFFTNDPDVLSAAVTNLRIEMIGQIFYAFFQTYHGMMTGAGHTMMVMSSSFVNCILVRVILVIILERFMGLNGVYLACMIAPSASVPIGMLYVKSGVWKRTYIKE